MPLPHPVPLIAGAATGAFLVHERLERKTAERLSAALLETLLRAIDANDAETGAHVRRVARYALILADAADLDEHAQRVVERIALFHDIGKIHEALFDLIHEQSTLSPEERRAIRTHPERGAEVLAPLAGFYPDLPAGVLAHHERWDGSGYPAKLRGVRIPLAARIVAIADTFDAITFRRRYSKGRSAQEAAQRIEEGRGTQFDPDLADLFLSPPVFEAVVAAMDHGELPSPRRRKRSPPETPAADVTFRWRTTTTAPPLPDHPPPGSP